MYEITARRPPESSSGSALILINICDLYRGLHVVTRFDDYVASSSFLLLAFFLDKIYPRFGREKDRLAGDACSPEFSEISSVRAQRTEPSSNPTRAKAGRASGRKNSGLGKVNGEKRRNEGHLECGTVTLRYKTERKLGPSDEGHTL